MNSLMYDPVIARVLSPDAYVQAPGYTQSYNRYSYCLNNPLRYTDPSGWLMAPLGEFWNLGAENLEMRIGTYYPPSLGGGGFSTPNWSNEIHDEYTNFMLMGSRGFNNLYGNGATDIARGLVSNPTVAGQWREGLISIGSVRQAGGYWTTTTSTLGNEQPVYDKAGRIIVVNLPTTIVDKKWNRISYLDNQKNINYTAGPYTSWIVIIGQIAEFSNTEVPNIGVEAIGKYGTRIGWAGEVVSNIVNGINIYRNPTWGNYGRLAVSLGTSATNLIPYVGPTISFGLSIYDTTGGFNNFYISLDNDQSLYNSTGLLIIPNLRGGYTILNLRK